MNLTIQLFNSKDKFQLPEYNFNLLSFAPNDILVFDENLPERALLTSFFIHLLWTASEGVHGVG